MQTLNALGDMEDSILEICMILKSETVEILKQSLNNGNPL